MLTVLPQAGGHQDTSKFLDEIGRVRTMPVQAQRTSELPARRRGFGKIRGDERGNDDGNVWCEVLPEDQDRHFCVRVRD